MVKELSCWNKFMLVCLKKMGRLNSSQKKCLKPYRVYYPISNQCGSFLTQYQMLEHEKLRLNIEWKGFMKWVEFNSDSIS